MGEQRTVTVDTEVELYPELVIREDNEHDRRRFAVPAALVDALEAARGTVDALEVAIMEHIAETRPDAVDVADWLRSRADDAVLTQVMEAWAAEHPDGPEWRLLPVVDRDRLLRAAGWSERA
jgi:hypothetical protein